MTLSRRQQFMHWSLWKRVKNVLMRGRETWTKFEENTRRHEIYAKALGQDKSFTRFTNSDLDLVKAAFLAIIEPDNLDAQLRQVRGEHKRLQWRLSQLMRELDVGRNYVQGIVDQMFTFPASGEEEKVDKWQRERQGEHLPRRLLDELTAEELRKVVIALQKHKRRGGGSVREYVLRPA